MRIPITVQSEPFDIEKAQPAIDIARQAFADYLEQVPRKSTKSKHGLMGPVGKIFSRIKSGRRDPTSLKGYAISVHELAVAQVRKAANRRTASPAAMANLDSGISTVVNLLKSVPVTFHDQILDRLDSGLYWDLRKRELDSKETRRQAWISHIREKYRTAEDLATAWDETGISFEELYLPRKDEGSRSKKATARQRDTADFSELPEVAASAEEEDE